MEWTPDKIAELTLLWNVEKLSASEIARRMGITKNAVVGKTGRLDLPGRPSPIRKRDPAAPQRHKPGTRHVVPTVTLAPLAAPAPAMPAPSSARTARTAGCCWPIGDPRSKEFHFCEGAALPGKPYCPDHSAEAYTRVRENHAA